MSRRIALLALVLLCLPAAAAFAAPGPAATVVPASPAAAACAQPTASDPVWLQRIDVKLSPELGSLLAPIQTTTCLQQCLHSDDPICCRWECHPIGESPC